MLCPLDIYEDDSFSPASRQSTCGTQPSSASDPFPEPFAPLPSNSTSTSLSKDHDERCWDRYRTMCLDMNIDPVPRESFPCLTWSNTTEARTSPNWPKVEAAFRGKSSQQLIENAAMLHVLIRQHASVEAGASVTFADQSICTLARSNEMAPSFLATNILEKTIDDDGTKRINHYLILKELGRGQCGKVKLAYDEELQRMVAIKIARRVKPDTSLNKKHRTFEQEIAVMKQLRHRNIVSLYEVIDDENVEKQYIVMQHIDGGPLSKCISYEDGTYEAIAPMALLQVAEDVLSAVAYLHRKRVVHRDIKLENVLVSEQGVAYLADFGLSEIFESRKDRDVDGFKGTPLYMCPELHHGTTTVNGYAADMWAVGVLLFTALTGRLPFRSASQISNFEDDHLILSEDFGEVWSNLIGSLLRREPSKRWKAKKALAFVTSSKPRDTTIASPLRPRVSRFGSAITPALLVEDRLGRRQSARLDGPSGVLEPQHQEPDQRAPVPIRSPSSVALSVNTQNRELSFGLEPSFDMSSSTLPTQQGSIRLRFDDAPSVSSPPALVASPPSQPPRQATGGSRRWFTAFRTTEDVASPKDTQRLNSSNIGVPPPVLPEDTAMRTSTNSAPRSRKASASQRSQPLVQWCPYVPMQTRDKPRPSTATARQSISSGSSGNRSNSDNFPLEYWGARSRNVSKEAVDVLTTLAGPRRASSVPSYN